MRSLSLGPTCRSLLEQLHLFPLPIPPDVTPRALNKDEQARIDVLSQLQFVSLLLRVAFRNKWLTSAQFLATAPTRWVGNEPGVNQVSSAETAVLTDMLLSRSVTYPNFSFPTEKMCRVSFGTACTISRVQISVGSLGPSDFPAEKSSSSRTRFPFRGFRQTHQAHQEVGRGCLLRSAKSQTRTRCLFRGAKVRVKPRHWHYLMPSSRSPLLDYLFRHGCIRTQKKVCFAWCTRID